MKEIERSIVQKVWSHLRKPPNLLQIIVGPRQVGKTTALQQILKRWPGPSHYASADLPSPPDPQWVLSQWEIIRQDAKRKKKKALLVLDEVQKVERWGEVIKACFDEDHRHRLPIRVVMLGSSSLRIQKGSQESLAGRFEVHFCPHWTWPECQKAFGWNLDQWLYYGGYPGSAALIRSPIRWANYVSSSLIESVLSRDVLHLVPIDKPALLKQLFMLSVHAHAQILSYNKMLGQLQDAGNTVTLAHYLDLLSSAYLINGLQMWTGGLARLRASSPKLVLWNNALATALAPLTFSDARREREKWGRLVENAVGGYLLNHAVQNYSIYYWRHKEQEVDYVVQAGRKIVAIEVKSGRKTSQSGLEAFLKRYPQAKALRVGTGGIALEKFFSVPPAAWF